MPTTLYALSFRSSGNILGVCSLGEQKLDDQAAWDALRDRLIGSKLVLTHSRVGPVTKVEQPELPSPKVGHSAPLAQKLSKLEPPAEEVAEFELPAEEVTVDAIAGSIHDVDDVLVNPYTYQVASPVATRPAFPGDGQPKVVTPANAIVKSETFQRPRLTITLQKPLSAQTMAVVLFESGALVRSSPEADLLTVMFLCTAEVGEKYLLFLPGVPVQARVLKA
ncbi:MAG TPA: hypothetical protein VNO30_41515 [Kofleriaceae bacterium]|nr:hypothetical protein [Kofleriaceae bacterium]